MIIMMLNIEVRINNESILTRIQSTFIKSSRTFYISMFALLLAIVVAVPLGILLSKRNAQLMWY